MECQIYNSDPTLVHQNLLFDEQVLIFGLARKKLIKSEVMKSDSPYRLYILGAFRLEAPSGEVISPKGHKAQALLGLLATANRGERSKSWLCSKLYPNARTESHARTNLRGFLRDLENHLVFGEHFSHLFCNSTDSISLKPNVLTDLHLFRENSSDHSKTHTLQYAELLEGLNLYSKGDDGEAFEDWLRDERLAISKEFESYSAYEISLDDHQVEPIQNIEINKESVPIDEATSVDSDEIYIKNNKKQDSLKVLNVVLLPSQISSFNENLNVAFQIAGDIVLENIVRNFLDCFELKIFDYRSIPRVSELTPDTNSIVVELRLRMIEQDGSFYPSFVAYFNGELMSLPCDMVKIPEKEITDRASEGLQKFISQNSDLLVFEIINRSQQLEKTNITSLSFLTLINFIQAVDIDRATLDKYIANALLLDQSSLPLGLMFYTNAMSVGDNLNIPIKSPEEIIRGNFTGLLTNHNASSVALSCVGHSFGYFENNYSLSQQFLERAILLNPYQSFNIDHYALYKIYTNDLKSAIINASRAILLGKFSPLLFSYQTTLGMALTLSRKFDEAIGYLHASLAQVPRSLPTRRYLMLAYAGVNDLDNSRDQLRYILQHDQDFLEEEVWRQRFRLTSKENIKFIRKKIETIKYGL